MSIRTQKVLPATMPIAGNSNRVFFEFLGLYGSQLIVVLFVVSL